MELWGDSIRTIMWQCKFKKSINESFRLYLIHIVQLGKTRSLFGFLDKSARFICSLFVAIIQIYRNQLHVLLKLAPCARK